MLSPTAQYGLNVFEGIRCYAGTQSGQVFAFRLKDHFVRLADSCRLIGIECPYPAGQLQEYLV